LCTLVDSFLLLLLLSSISAHVGFYGRVSVLYLEVDLTVCADTF
jgi:hypothetical protein